MLVDICSVFNNSREDWSDFTLKKIRKGTVSQFLERSTLHMATKQ